MSAFAWVMILNLIALPVVLTLGIDRPVHPDHDSITSHCKHVYTIGAYDEAFAKQITVTKLGPLVAVDVLPTIPKSFLEKDGSYGGGEALCTIVQACRRLKKQLATGQLPKNENWHIYLLAADWNRDTYQLHLNDYRIKHSVKVLKLVKKAC